MNRWKDTQSVTAGSHRIEGSTELGEDMEPINIVDDCPSSGGVTDLSSVPEWRRQSTEWLREKSADDLRLGGKSLVTEEAVKTIPGMSHSEISS